MENRNIKEVIDMKKVQIYAKKENHNKHINGVDNYVTDIDKTLGEIVRALNEIIEYINNEK